MSTITINSEVSLQTFIGDIREQWNRHKFLRVTVKAGKDRSLDQNAISHAWYEQLARELREYDALGWKCECKLLHGVPILRAEDPEFRRFYDGAIKATLMYPEKLAAMKFVPVTSLMTKQQLSKYLEAMREHFLRRGVRLEFPLEAA
jgi:hypothetical protein